MNVAKATTRSVNSRPLRWLKPTAINKKVWLKPTAINKKAWWTVDKGTKDGISIAVSFS
jgi:hypothetical protein